MRSFLIVSLAIAALSCGGSKAVVPPVAKPAPAPQTFGECLAEKVQTLYVASWCGHCHDQVEMLGADVAYLRVIDCYPAGHEGDIVDECEMTGIDAFPLWLLKSGRRLTGAYPPIILAQELGCPAP